MDCRIPGLPRLSGLLIWGAVALAVPGEASAQTDLDEEMERVTRDARELMAQVEADEAAVEAAARINKAVANRDPQTIHAAIVSLDEVYADISPKAEAKVAKAMDKLFSKLRPRDEIREDGTTDREDIQQCYEMAVGLLFDKPCGVDVLVTAMKQRHIKEWPDVQANILEGLGHRQDPDQLSFLAKYLDHEDGRVVGSAARALGRLSEAEGKVRRVAAEHILDAWADLDKRARKESKKDPEGEVNRLVLAVESPFGEALIALTRQDFRSLEEWRLWWDRDADEVEW